MSFPWHRHWEKVGEFGPGMPFVHRMSFARWLRWKLGLLRPELIDPALLGSIDPLKPSDWKNRVETYR